MLNDTVSFIRLQFAFSRLTQKWYPLFQDIDDCCGNHDMHDIEGDRIANRHFGYKEEWTKKGKQKQEPRYSLEYAESFTGNE